MAALQVGRNRLAQRRNAIRGRIAVMAIAQRLAKGPQIAYRELKRVLDEAPFNTLDQQLENERRTQRVLGDTEDFREGVISFLTKRDPSFKSK